MDPLTGALVLLGVAVATGLYKRFGRPKIKKWFDDPKTPEDESAMIDGFAQAGLKLAVESAIKEGLKEARKNPKLDQASVAAEKLVERYGGSMRLEDAKKLVDAALKGK